MDNGLRSAPVEIEPTTGKFGVKLDRGVVRDVNGEPLTTWEQADEARRKIEEMLGEKGEVVRVLL